MAELEGEVAVPEEVSQGCYFVCVPEDTTNTQEQNLSLVCHTVQI